MNRAIERMLKARTVIVDKRLIVLAPNHSFPKLADNLAARMLLQDICDKFPNYQHGISHEALK
jgi:hypothetical protein